MDKITKKKDLPRECSNCANKGTMKCPNSFYCYSKVTKPFLEPKKKKHVLAWITKVV